MTTGARAGGFRLPVCVDTLIYTGQDAIAADIEHVKAALSAAGIDEGFMTSIAPGSASRIGNEHYASEEEFLFACADAMREEYRAIIEAGLILQLDDPAIAENWDMINPAPSVEDYRKFSMLRIAALNHALKACRASGFGFICAGEAGMARTSPTSRCATSSTACWRWIARPIRLRPAMSATSMNGRCGRR